jgi:hypothetical protein
MRLIGMERERNSGWEELCRTTMVALAAGDLGAARERGGMERERVRVSGTVSRGSSVSILVRGEGRARGSSANNGGGAIGTWQPRPAHASPIEMIS